MKRTLAVLTQPRRFELVEDDVHIGDNQVLVKVEACGLCSWELYHFHGKFGSPLTLGHEPSGVVADLGKNVEGFQIGDRVTGFFKPGFATYAAASPSSIIKIPEGVKTEHALGEPLACVSNIVRAANPEFGDYVLFFGCGFMNLLALSALVGRRPAELIAVDVLDSKLKIAEDIGATVTLNPKEVDLVAEVKRITRNRGVDIVLEATGKPGIVDSASELLRTGRGKLLLVSSHSHSEKVNMELWQRGTIILNPHPPYSLDLMDDLRRGIEGLARGVFPMERLITHRFRLNDIQRAFETYSKKPEDYVKGVVIP